jgi:hypothetical protein
MRWLVVTIVLAAAVPAAADDGYYLTESFGGGDYQGELGYYGDGMPMLHVGVGVRRAEWSVEVLGHFAIPDLYYIDCYGSECAYAARPQAGLNGLAVDVRKRWRLLSMRRIGKPGVYERPGLFVALHGGGRWFWADQALDRYQGPGIGGGAALEGDLWILGYFLDLGMDLVHLRGPGPTVHGSTPYIMVGAKIGWL